jgi:hypothetical protein
MLQIVCSMILYMDFTMALCTCKMQFFYGTRANVISFTSITKVGVPTFYFKKPTNTQHIFSRISYIKFSSNGKRNF